MPRSLRLRILITVVLLLLLGFLLCISLGFDSLLAFPAMILGTILLTSRKGIGKRTELVALACLEVALVLFFVPGFFVPPYEGLTSTAIVSVRSVSCDPSTLVCSATLTNTGSADTYVVGCNLTFGGVSHRGSVTGDGARDVPAGGQAITLCNLSIATSPGPSPGSSFAGTFTLSNGGVVQFTGVWP